MSVPNLQQPWRSCGQFGTPSDQGGKAYWEEEGILKKLSNINKMFYALQVGNGYFEHS